MSLGMDYFVLIVLIVYVELLVQINDFQIWKVLSHCFLKYCFCPSLSLFFWDFQDAYVGTLDRVTESLLGFVYFFFFRLDYLNWFIFKFFLLLIETVKLLYWICHFSYCNFQLQNTRLFFIISVSLFIVCILWDIILILSFNSLYTISFYSLNVSVRADLKALSSKFKIWASSGIVSFECFFSLSVWAILSYFFVCLIIFCWKLGHFKLYIVTTL